MTNEKQLKAGWVKCPAGMIELNTQREVADYLRMSRTNAGRLMSAGAIRPAHSTCFQNFYDKKSLAEMVRDPVTRIKRLCLSLTDSERAKLAAGVFLEQLNKAKADAKTLSLNAPRSSERVSIRLY